MLMSNNKNVTHNLQIFSSKVYLIILVRTSIKVGTKQLGECTMWAGVDSDVQ